MKKFDATYLYKDNAGAKHLKDFYRIYVYEDNAGGLHLVVFDNEATPVFYHTGYERNEGFLSVDIDALMHGDSPLIWDCNDIDELDIEYLEWECELIAVGDIVKGVTYFYSNMGNAGRREFA